MRPSPFLDDPRDALKRHVALAVSSPMEAVSAIHLNRAIDEAEIARVSGLLPPSRSPAR